MFVKRNIWSRQERVPLPVGIGDGGGAGRFSPPVLRVMDMAVYGQNERMNEEGEGVKVVGFLGLISLAAERVPLPVGIGDGGGAGRFSPPVLRVMDMAVYGQNERMNEEGEGVKVVGFLGLVSSKEPFVYFLVRGVCTLVIYQLKRKWLFSRYINIKKCVIECFLGTVYLKNIIALSFKECIIFMWKGYDDMKGEFHGLKDLIMKNNPFTYYIHCFSYYLQLALVSIDENHAHISLLFIVVSSFTNVTGAS
ncbi:hypothetical protein SADUNF_Sadunf04G0160700 [Salix dunnii]|uniref:Uncharacterized protein n=1 Tax=Salix dunnii TaxID=1413687 RepID=A0A835KAA0_9ROSI|nr:hypothetical protein SADUNF_Sadunf04G0160700 [Salix dunnii]